MHLEQGNNVVVYCFINVTTIYTALFPAFTLFEYFILFGLYNSSGCIGVKIYAGKTVRSLGHRKDWWRLWNSPQKRVCASQRLPLPLKHTLLFPKELISRFLNLGGNIQCMQMLKVVLLQLLSPPCLVNFYKNPRQVLSTSAALRISCQSPWSCSCP